MKKLMIFAALALIGCGSDKPASGKPGDPTAPGGSGYRSAADPTAPDVNPVGSAPVPNLMNHAQNAVNKIEVPRADFDNPK